MDTVVALGVGAALLVSLAGAFFVRIPGVPLGWAAIVVWAAVDDTPVAWTAAGAATLLAIANYFVQHRMAGGTWSQLAVADRSWIVGAGVGIVGALLAKVPGLIFGFIGGVYAAERRRLGAQGIARNAADRPGASPTLSWPTLAEFATAAAIAAAWLLAYAG